MKTFTDMDGVQLQAGQLVARAFRSGNAAYLEKRTVARITPDRVYLNGSHVPLQRTDNLLVIRSAS